MKKNNVVFRTSVNGYNKKDVYNYLDSVNKDITNRANEYEEQISARDEKIKILEDDNNQLQSDLNKSIEENCQLKDQLENAVAQKTQYDAEIESLKEELDNKSAMVEEIDVACVKISLELDKLLCDYNALNEKYLELYSSVGDVEELKQKADSYDKIVKRAKEKMGQSTPQSPLKEDDGESIDNVLSGAAFRIIDQMRDSQLKFSGAIADMQKETEALKERINLIINSFKR